MELNLLDTDLNRVNVLDLFDSLIWTDRYTRHGDFEIFTTASARNIAMLPQGHILTMSESEHAMIIETLELTTDLEEGNKFKVTGRSLESILERRIIWKQTILSGSFQTAIERLLNENAINPEDPDRRIPNLIFEMSLDPEILSLSIDTQFTGDNLYTAIQQLCTSYQVGFKISISLDKKFVFTLYAGKDRSFSQITNPFVAFSPELDNLSGTNYYHSSAPYKTITLVAGEGEGSDRLTAQVALPGSPNTGLDRREKFTDARDISILVDGEALTPEEYYTLLVQRGVISLLESQQVSYFDGRVDPTTNYAYGQDFFLGDIVQIENEYGIRGRSRMTELVFSEDLSGRDVYPTFEMIEE